MNAMASTLTTRKTSLSPSLRKALLSAHIITAVALLGADAVVLALGVAGLGGWDPRTVYPAMHLVATDLMAPLALLALVTGVALAVSSRWGLFRHAWVTTKLVVTTLGTIAIVAALVPGTGRASIAATSGGMLPEQQEILYVLVPIVTVTLLVLNTVLGVYKPRRRRPA
jgi:hypothetical protein